MKRNGLTVVFAVLALSTTTAIAQDVDVRIVLADEPPSLEPCSMSSNLYGRVGLGNIFEGLTERDPTTGEVVPAIATSWEESGDKSWRFDIRGNVTMHDGSTLDADDVVHSIRRTLNENLNCENRTKFFADAGDFSVEKIDDDTVEITTPVRDPILPLKLSNVMIHPDTVPMDELVRSAPGTGPYTLQDWQTGQYMRLARFPQYWRDAPSIETAEFLWRPESSVRAAMVELGEADLAPQIAIQDAKEAYGVGYPNAETTRLNLDSLTPPLDDIRVREAINHAIDRQAMLGTVLSPDAELATQLYVPQTAGWSEEVRNWAYDQGKAAALLDEARGEGVPVDTEIQFVGRIGHFPNANDFHEVVAIMLNEAGLNVKLEWFEGAAKNRMQVKPFEEGRRPQIFVDQHDNTSGDPVFTVPSRYGSQGAQSKLNDEELDRLISEATAATGAERAAAWKRVAGRVDALVPDAMLFHMAGHAAVGERIDYEPTVTTNSSIRLSDITLK